ncbi:MAG TPA: amidohydrolase family protein [Candidatus Acidoferrales bacterium]|nr:amidohydrolase family protein [Candidatus Acidoferrales bacterium]
MKTLLRNATVVTMNSQKEILENCDLLLNDDRVERVLPQSSRAGLRADQDLDCTGKIIIPGLVSAHSHLTGIFQRGLWDGISFAEWQTKSNATEELVNLSAEEIYFLHTASCIEFLRNGVTTALNMFTVRPPLNTAKLEAACKAFRDTRMRGIVAVMFRNRAADGKSLPGREDQSWIPRAREILKRLTGVGSSISFMLAPSAPQLCSDQLLISCRDLAEELDIGIHTHVAETKQQADLGRRLYGESIVKHLQKIGLLNARLSIAHANWIDESDIAVLKQHDVKVVHNPSANTKLGTGFPRVKQLLNNGLTLGLGADSVNAGTVYSIFEQMKLCVLVPRVLWNAEHWVVPEEAFAMGTIGGAKALLLDHFIGSIEEGKKADLVILNPGTSLLPRNNIIGQLALSENGRSVETVFVDGKPVLMDGRLQTIQDKDILSKLDALGPRIQAARQGVLESPAR